jgi:uncharacterized protein YbcV (DUF1398 family)
MTAPIDFTIEQVNAAHAKVKSGADFPKYIQEIKQLGVKFYETYVVDGHTDFYDKYHRKASTSPKYDLLKIANVADAEAFKIHLNAHQQGKTDYLTFCNDCSKSGVNKWVVRLDKMTCTYYDLAGREILVEGIPQ